MTQTKSIQQQHKKLLFPILLYIVFVFPVSILPSVMVQPLIRSLQGSIAEIGFITSAFYYTYVFFQWPMGLLLDKHGALMLLRVCAGIIVLSLLIFYFSTNILTAFLARLLAGIGSSIAIPGALFIIHHGFPKHKFLFLAGLVECLVTLSAGISQPFFSLIIEYYNWTALVFILFLIGVLLELVYLMIYRPVNKVYVEFESAPEQIKSKFCYSSHVLLNGLVTGLIFTMIVGFFGFWCIYYLENVYQIPKITAALYSGMGFIAAGICTPLVGYFFTNVDQQYKILVAGIVILFATSLLLTLKLTTSFIIIPTLIVICGISASVYVIPFALVQRNCPNSVAGITMAIVNILCGVFGSVFIIPLIGFLEDSSYGPHFNLEYIIYIFPLCFLIALLISIFCKQKIKHY